MTRRRSAWVIVEPNRLLIKGWRISELMREGGFRATYAGTVKAWILDAHRLTDLIAFLEYRNVSVTVTERGTAA